MNFRIKKGYGRVKWRSIKRDNIRGIAIANLQLFVDNPNFVQVQSLNPENMDQFADYLVREGYIVPVDEEGKRIP